METRRRTVEEDDQALLAVSCALAPRKRRSSAADTAGFATPITGRTPIKKPKGAGATVTSRTGKEGPAAAVGKPPKRKGDNELGPLLRVQEADVAP
jgi:hypothetical protein